MKGIAYLIGAGPGDPGLFTLKGKACVEAADVVIYDYLADEELLGWAPSDAELIYAGKQAGNHALTQDEINALLVNRVAAGHVVARLKGGDPLVFGRGGEEAMALRAAGLAFEIVPGVTSAIAAPAYAGIPVTQRAMATSFAVVTGHEDPTKETTGVNWKHIACGADTLTFVMGLGNLPDIAARLQEYGRDAATPAAVVRWGTKPEQQTVVGTLATIAQEVERAGLKPPGLLIVGDVVGLRPQLNWFEEKPLFGARVVVTRARKQAGALSRLLRQQGAYVMSVPAIRTVATDNHAEQDAVLHNLAPFDWVLFTSVNTVEYFAEALVRNGLDMRALAGKTVMAVGKKTAAGLAKAGIVADSVPANASAEGMLAVLEGVPMKGRKVLLPRAAEARELLPDTLREAGAEVTVLPVYRTEPELRGGHGERLAAALREGTVDVVTFTSASTVRNIVAMLGDDASLLRNVQLIAIGDITAAELHAYGLQEDGIAEEATIEALAEAVAVAYRKESDV